MSAFSARRRWIATLALALTFAAAAVVALAPAIRADKPGFIALLGLLIGIPVTGRAGWRKPGRVIWAVVAAAALAVPAVVIARGFGRVDMISVLFHTTQGMAGAGLSSLQSEILQGVLSVSLIVLCVLMIAALWRLSRRVLWGLATALLLTNPVAQYGVLTLIRPALSSTLPQELIALPQATSPRDHGDVLIVYVEGTDRQFADPAVWGDLYQPFSELAAQGLSLTGVRQVTGTGWSLAGMVASLCGVPAVPNGFAYGNNYADTEAFMTGIDCLGDVLAQRGYATAYVVGGDLAFTGIGQFYRDHGFADVTGLTEFQAIMPAEQIETALIDWVLDDHFVIAQARAKHAVLAANPAPFALVVETIGPHGRIGFLSQNCSDSGKGEESSDARRVLDCTIKEVRGFVDHVRAEQARLRPGRALHVVVASDHLSHNTTTPEVAAEFSGANTVIFVGPNTRPGQVIAREASMIDVFPTLLDLIGALPAPGAANLGRSLLAPGKTLIETHGKARIDDIFARDGKLAARIWQADKP